MSLSSTINKMIHEGNGATTVWPFPFPVLEAGHLTVILTDGTGLETVLSPSLYGVAGVGDPAGGSVTYPLLGSPIASDTKLTLLRTVPYTQTTVLSNQGGYYPEVVERRFDQIYMALQQLEERVSRVDLSPVSEPATEQGNLALIHQLQLMNILTTQGDLLTRNGSAYQRLGRGTAGQFLGVNGADLAWAIPSQPVAPQGRLTLVSGKPVMTGDQTGNTSIFYTPYVGSNVPIYDGSAFVPTAFAERSNDLTQSSTNKAGPAAAGPYQVIDAFIWNDSGTVRLTRGPKWRKSATVTVSIATPGVVTWNAHGLYDGCTFRFTATTIALPTGVALNTDYFVTVVDANNFKLSTTLANQVAGTFIATSGSQSGDHTGENYTVDRGTGAGTSELELLNGVWVNRVDITNGPLARKGTFVGTIYSNGSSQVDFKTGSLAVGGGEASIGVWNTYNRVFGAGVVSSSVATWPAVNGTRVFAGSATFRATLVSGLAEDCLSGVAQDYITFDLATSTGVAIGFRSLTPLGVAKGFYYNGGGWPASINVHAKTLPFLGLGYWVGLEICNNFTSSFVNSSGGSTYVAYDWRY
ncbi:hypothetical protein [Reyranella sp.]|uniref:hypothetical protein n=1 Tax=Reyranella sp. TaxID=1929291 RepID=UPI0027317C7D|nr:hypothetical protein [Reyranella sp.]MDP2376411.1 hypothetical protein [Reyranella sp.]